MAKKALTAKFVENVKPNGKRQEFCDPYLRGFGLRVSKMGTKTFYVRLRYRRKIQRHTIGTYPSFSLAEAKAKASEIIAQAEKGELHKAAEQKLTIKEAYDRFIQLYAKVHNKDWAGSDSRLKKFMAEYGNMNLVDLHRRDIIAFLDKLVAEGTPTQAKHSGGNRFNRELAGNLNNIYAAGFTPVIEDARYLNPYIFFAERKLIWEYILAHGTIPACNGH